ncbi:MAG: hypothetical protein IJ058_12460 [Lachnospiraceae bacterium]|nr:hypothetical protein [Lachnospiraceae bacterium]
MINKIFGEGIRLIIFLLEAFWKENAGIMSNLNHIRSDKRRFSNMDKSIIRRYAGLEYP